MNRQRLIGLVVVFIMVFSLWCGLGVKSAHGATTIQLAENQLTLNNADQQNPDIYEYDHNWWAAVWQDNRNGNWDIYMYYQKPLGDGIWDVQWDTRITANSGQDVNPKIYNDIVVFQSNRNGNWDIYIYNITSKVETPITTNTADQGYPAIDGNIIVWQDYRNAYGSYFTNNLDVYMYNLTSKTEQVLPLPEQNAYSPAISGNKVVYAAENYEIFPSGNIYAHPYICSYDISTEAKIIVAAGTVRMRGGVGLVTSDPQSMDSPAIDGNLVAWKNNDARVIGVKNVSSGSTWQSANGYHMNPDISGNFVVYQTYYTYAYWHLNLYDSSNGLLYQVTDAVGHQQNPAIATKHGNMILYQDDKSGHWHIYLTAFWYSLAGVTTPSPPITPNRVINNLQESRGRISEIATSDFAGANDKVKENRRNALINQLDSAITNVEAAAYTENLKLRINYFQRAIEQLNDLTYKLDGWSSERGADIPGSGFTPDWITGPFYLDQTIRSCRNDLQALLNGI